MKPGITTRHVQVCQTRSVTLATLGCPNSAVPNARSRAHGSPLASADGRERIDRLIFVDVAATGVAAFVLTNLTALVSRWRIFPATAKDRSR